MDKHAKRLGLEVKAFVQYVNKIAEVGKLLGLKREDVRLEAVELVAKFRTKRNSKNVHQTPFYAQRYAALYSLIQLLEKRCSICHGCGTITRKEEIGVGWESADPDLYKLVECYRCKGAGILI